MKKIAVLNDLSGMGKCSLTAAIPVISVMGIQACPLPTAVLSAQTGFPSYYCDDYTDRMDAIMEEWKKMDFYPDGIYTGFLADARQADKAVEFIEQFAKEDTKILIDPVMGDNGEEYPIYTEALCEKMRFLVRRATVITPNLTEALLLLYGAQRGAAEAGHQVEKIFLKDKHINYCTGCSVCSMYGKPCPQKDDAAEVVEKMIAADVIVMATPVYFYTMSAQMKTLIDRCCARYLEIKNKEFYFIIAAAEESVPMMERTIDGFRGFLDCLEEPKECGTIYGVGAWKVGEINDKPSMHEAYEMGKKV